MASKKTGALAVIGRKAFDIYSEGGENYALISAELLKSIFFKNSPLHDGAVLIEDGRYLPHDVLSITDNVNLQRNWNETQAAIGILNIPMHLLWRLEETGTISIAEAGEAKATSPNELREVLLQEKI